LDIETTGIDLFDDIFGIGIATFPNSYYIPIRHTPKVQIQRSLFDPSPYLPNVNPDEALSFVKELVSNIPTVFHNSAFDVTHFTREGIPPSDWRCIEDTFILCYLHDERLLRVRGALVLESLTNRYFNYEPQEEHVCKEWVHGHGGPKGKRNWKSWMVNIPTELVANYCCADVEQTFSLFFHPEVQALRDRFYNVYRNECNLIPLVAKLNNTPLPLDIPTLKSHSTTLKEKLQTLKEQIAEVAGDGFNPDSSEDVGQYLLSQGHRLNITDKNKISADDDVLRTIDDPITELLQTYRTTRKVRSTYISGLLKKARPMGYYSEWKSISAKTGRFSSSLGQVFPKRDPDLKKMCRGSILKPDPDFIWISLDFSQLQLRIVAHLSQDPTMLSVYESQGDIHTETATYVFKTPEPTKQERQISKTLNFAVLFGAGPDRLQYTLRGEDIDLTYEECADICRRFRNKYKGVNSYKRRLVNHAFSHGFIVNPFGRQRYLKGWERIALNAMVQSTEADLVKFSMCRLWNEIFSSSRSVIMAQIHDEVFLSIHKSEIGFIPKIVHILTDWSSIFTVDIELGATVHAQRWSDEVEIPIDDLVSNPEIVHGLIGI